MIDKTISHYEILEKIGEGGMGVVYKAEDTKLKRIVALKFLPKEMTRSEEARNRFKLEAQAAAALNNPNIITIHEIDEYEGNIYIAMEYMEGETLRAKMPYVWEQLDTPFEDPDPYKTQRIAPVPSGGKLPAPRPLDLKVAVDYALQVCNGLEAAHKLGIVHRDIKPQNIAVNKDGVVKILDFGLAKLTRDTNITKEFATEGTIYYMSPDQLTGKEIDMRTDIWSFGVVLFEMLTAQLPFKQESMQAIMYAIAHENPMPPSEIRDDIPRALEKIILKCLRKDRDERYQAVTSLKTDLLKIKKKFLKDSTELELRKKKSIKKETERRQATVINAEISAYKELMVSLDAEEAAAIMNSCFEMFANIVEKYGGHVDKIMENSLSALFGVPMAVENAPNKAVNAAIEMRNRLHSFNKEHKLKIPLDIRAGINSGMVIAGEIGKDDKKDFTVMGDTVTIASQVKDLASPGQVYVGPLTHRSTRDDFEYKQLKPITIKGQPFAICELLSNKTKIHRPVFSSERMIHSEMVGRDKEFDKLRLHVMKLIDGEGSIVSLIGEAGTGKSRLMAELKNTIDEKKTTILEGRALSIGKNLSYHPLINILKGWAEITEEDSESESLSKLEKAIAYITPESADEIFPFVATMMGMKLVGKHAERIKGIESEAMEKLIIKNMRELIIKGADRRPVVFIIEDLHWADISSISLLEILFRVAEKSRVLFINCLRPGYRETGEQVLETIKERYERIKTEIYLKSLDEKQCETLIHNLAKGKLPTAVRAAIIKRTGGNPFFIEEVIRSFIDEGVVEFKDGKLKVTAQLNSVVIPETIQDVLMTRIDRLDEITRALLKEASVIGRYFFHKILMRVTQSGEDMDESLEYLKNIELIRERMRFEEVEYHFKDALVHEVTYESILLKKRKELHLKVAEAIEAVFPERLHEFYGMLALHYSRGENPEKAEEYLIKAGEESLKAAASSEALTYYQEGLKLYLDKYAKAADPEKIATLEKKIGMAFYTKGSYVEAVKHFDSVLDYLGLKRSKNMIISIFRFVIDLLKVLKNVYFPSKKAKHVPDEREAEVLEVAYYRGTVLASVDTIRLLLDSICVIRILCKYDLAKAPNGVTIFASSSALFSFSALSFKIAGKLLDYTRSYIGPGDEKAMFIYESYEVITKLLSGNWDNEYEYKEAIVNGFLDEGDLFMAPNHMFFNGVMAVEQGRFEFVKRYKDKLNEISELYESEYCWGLRWILGARLMLKSRNLPEALKDAETGIALANRRNQLLDAVMLHGLKAYIQVLQGDSAGAEKSLQEAEEIYSQEKQVVPWYCHTYRLGRFFFDIYNLEKNIYSNNQAGIREFGNKAKQSGKTALKIAARCAIIQTDSFRLMGLYCWLTGNQKKALSWWDKSIKTGERLNARPDLARTYVEIGKRLSEEKSKETDLNGIGPQEYFKKARAIFEEMKLESDLHELDKIEN